MDQGCSGRVVSSERREQVFFKFGRVPDLSDVSVKILCMLPLRWLMMIACTCKGFAVSQKAPSFPEIMRKCLCCSFPLMDLETLPPALPSDLETLPSGLSSSDWRRLYVEYFFDFSTGVSLFTRNGRRVLDGWLDMVFHSSDLYWLAHNNLALNLDVLRRGGFFSSFYARMCLTDFLRIMIDRELGLVHDRINRNDHDPWTDEFEERMHSSFGRIVRCVFVTKIAQTSFSVSECPIHSDRWKHVSMHCPFLPLRSSRWHIDIAERDVMHWNATFEECCNGNVDVDRLKELIPQFRGCFFHIVVNHLLRTGGTSPNSSYDVPGFVGLFHRFFFDMKTYPKQPEHLGLEDEEYDITGLSEHDIIFPCCARNIAAVKLCSESDDWGIQKGVGDYLGSDWQRLAEDRANLDKMKSMCRRLVPLQCFLQKKRAVVRLQAVILRRVSLPVRFYTAMIRGRCLSAGGAAGAPQHGHD